MNNKVKLKDYLANSRIKENQSIHIFDPHCTAFDITVDTLPNTYRNRFIDYVDAYLEFGCNGIFPMIEIVLESQDENDWR